MIKFAHNNFNVLNLEKSMAFYEEALNLKEVRRVEKPDFSLVYLGDNGETPVGRSHTHTRLAAGLSGSPPSSIHAG